MTLSNDHIGLDFARNEFGLGLNIDWRYGIALWVGPVCLWWHWSA